MNGIWWHLVASGYEIVGEADLSGDDTLEDDDTELEDDDTDTENDE